MSEVKRFTEGPIGKGIYANPEGELCGFHHLERVTAERDAALGREAAITRRELLIKEKLADCESALVDAQQRLTAADEQARVLTSLLREGLEEYKDGDDWIDRVIAALRPAEGGGDEFLHDRAYRNGLMQGYNLAINGSEKEYQDAVARYSGGKDAK